MMVLVILTPILAIGLGIFIASVCTSRRIEEQYSLENYIGNDGQVNYIYNLVWGLFPGQSVDIKPNSVISVANTANLYHTIVFNHKKKKIKYIPGKLERANFGRLNPAIIDLEDCWFVPFYVKKHKQIYFFMLKRNIVKQLPCLSDEDRLILEVL